MIAEPHCLALADMFKLLGDPSRLRIVLCCLEGPMSVGTIVGHVGLSQSLVSHHLRLLRANRLLKSERDGRQVFYTLSDRHVRDVLTNLIAHVTEPHGPEAHDQETDDERDDGEVRLR